MAVCCRTFNVKPMCVNYLLSSFRSHLSDSHKLYHQINEKYMCNIKPVVRNVAILPQYNQQLQSSINFTPCTQSDSPSLSLSSRISSHNLLTQQDNYFTYFSNIENQTVAAPTVLNIQDKTSVKESKTPKDSVSPPGRPSEEQVEEIFRVLSEALPHLFVRALDYKYYDKELVIEDNIRNIRTVGVVPFVKFIALLRTVGHLKFAFVKLNVLKITSHPEEGCVKVRWTINGISALKAMFKFWKIKFWNLKETIKKEEIVWYDGFSIFYVNDNGLIHKITIDKMMPDQENKTSKTDKLPLAARLAILGLLPEHINF